MSRVLVPREHGYLRIRRLTIGVPLVGVDNGHERVAQAVRVVGGALERILEVGRRLGDLGVAAEDDKAHECDENEGEELNRAGNVDELERQVGVEDDDWLSVGTTTHALTEGDRRHHTEGHALLLPVGASTPSDLEDVLGTHDRVAAVEGQEDRVHRKGDGEEVLGLVECLLQVHDLTA